MTANPLVIARRLAIRLLHEAQVAAPRSIDGVVPLLDGAPSGYLPLERAEGHAVWARVFSNPSAPAIPSAAELWPDTLTLMISLDIKGVLELRAWVQQNGAPFERAVSVID